MPTEPNSDDDFSQNKSPFDELRNALKKITEPEKKVLREILSPNEFSILESLHFRSDGVEKSYVEVSETMGVTPERVRMLELRALTKVSHPRRSSALKDLLD